MEEELLQFIWENLLLERSMLRTTSGQLLEIIEPGKIQHGQGPDLDGAIVRIEGQKWAGTIEVHNRSKEWFDHGHHVDPAYDNVILHVVIVDDKPAVTCSGRRLPTLALEGRIDSTYLNRYRDLMRSKAWIPCKNELKHVQSILNAGFGDELLERRLTRLSGSIIQHLKLTNNDESQVFYQFLMRAMGLKENAEPFEILARSLPIRLLRKYRGQTIRVEALLFGQAGMLGGGMDDSYAQLLFTEYDMLRKAHGLTSMSISSWKYGRVRPNNFPEVRMALFAQLLESCDGNLNGLMHETDHRSMRETLMVTAREEWDERYTLHERGKKYPKSIGAATADRIIVNAVVPFLYATGIRYGRPEYKRRAVELLERIPTRHDKLLRGWKNLGVECRTMHRAQSLTELKNELCSHKKCLTCRVGHELMLVGRQ